MAASKSRSTFYFDTGFELDMDGVIEPFQTAHRIFIAIPLPLRVAVSNHLTAGLCIKSKK